MAKASDSPGACLPFSAGHELSAADRAFLLQLQRQALTYFLDNQTPSGLILDRQTNRGSLRPDGLCSTAATGMGFIALALASAQPYSLLTAACAASRIRLGVETCLNHLPHDAGVVAHFLDSRTHQAWGRDQFSTVETAWLVAGALWAGAFLRDPPLEALAARLYERVNWHYWTAPDEPGGNGLLRHGKDQHGRFFDCTWDRANGETAFMVVLAAGAAKERRINPGAWSALRTCPGTVAGYCFNNADLGLFVFQYGFDLLDLHRWSAPDRIDWMAEAKMATRANHNLCRELADTFATYQRYWGLSAGDGPGDSPGADVYRCYAPARPIDGTAHLTATLASVAHEPALVLQNLYAGRRDRHLSIRGRYGFSAVNVDRGWVSRDMIGIDAGAAALALDNYLMGDRIRQVFNGLPVVREGLSWLGFRPITGKCFKQSKSDPQFGRLAS
jgi:hypothetical protein